MTKVVRQVKKVPKKIIDDSESEDENRVVKSEKDKRFDELREIGKKLKNTRKNNDLNATMNHFLDLTKDRGIIASKHDWLYKYHNVGF